MRSLAQTFYHDQFTFFGSDKNRFTFKKRLNGRHPLKRSNRVQKLRAYRHASAGFWNNLNGAVKRDEKIPGKLLKTVQHTHHNKQRADPDDNPGKTDSRNDIDNPESFTGKTETTGNP